MTPTRKSALLGDGTSRQNKLWLAAGWGVEWRWSGAPPSASGLMTSRLEFLIDGAWQRARSWDEDVKPNLREAGTRTAAQ